MLNEIEIQLGTNPHSSDTDGDGLSDHAELFVHGTDPLRTDTDGDGMPDGWEVQHGLSPRFNDVADDLDGDGLSNLAEYNWSLSHTNQVIDPRTKYSTSATLSDFAVVTGTGTNQFFYDRNNRLIGAEFDRGLALAYVYDGNDNLVRQVAMQHDANTNGLPDVWEFLNGLTNNADAYADFDGDGWSDWQEWKSGTQPTNALSAPNLLGNPGAQIASLQLPFTPSNFVVGVGQLNGSGAEEIVIGADGNPGTNVNFLLVLTQAATTWQTQRVDVGAFGITSIAVGQVTNRPSPGIYVGLRGTTNGSGRVMEFTSNGGIWQSNLVAVSTNQAAFVLGVRGGNDLLAAFAPTNGVEGGLFSLVSLTNLWSSLPLGTNTSHRGLGTLSGRDDTNQTSLRLLDGGGIQVGADSIARLMTYYPFDGNANDASGNGNNGTNNGVAWVNGVRGGAAEFNGTNAFIEANAFPDSASFSFAAWLFITDVDSASRVIFVEGDAAGYADLELTPANQLRFYIKGVPSAVAYAGFPTNRWFHCAGVGDAQSNLEQLWIDGVKVVEQVFSGQANVGHHCRLQVGRNYVCSGTPQFYFKGKLDDLRFYSRSISSQEIVILASTVAPSLMLPEPSATRARNWRGSSLASGILRGTNGNSVLYTFADDKNDNGPIDFADDFVTAEYLVSGTNASLLTLSRHPIVSLTPAQSYGLASVNFLNASNEVFFTGEPDGHVFAWIATGATNPLQRQLFSGQHAGKAWHALAGVKTFEPGEGLIGLRVDPVSPNKCDVILWSPQSQLPPLVNLPNTAPAAAVLPAANTLSGSASLILRLWDAEGNASTPFLQYRFSGSTNWQSATLDSPSAPLAASPVGLNHTLVWNALGDIGANVVTNISLRARASDMTLLGDWSAPTPFQLNTALADNDGMDDSWELLYFSNTLRPGTGDFDSDGFTDYQEYISDTNPTNAASHLSLSVSLLPEGVILDWLAGSNSWKYLQRAISLSETNTAWLNIWTSPPPPSADSGSFTDFFGTNAMQFYRLKVTR